MSIQEGAPQVRIVVIDNFLDDPALDSLYGALTELSRASELMETQPAVPEPAPDPGARPPFRPAPDGVS